MVAKENATKNHATKRTQLRATLSEPDRLALLLSLIADLDAPVDAGADT